MKLVLSSLLVLLIAIGCNTTKKNGSTDILHGKWTMTNYSAFMPQIPGLEDGDIVWTFDAKKSTLSVVKKDQEKHSFMGPNTGTYTYTKDPKKITINGADYFYSTVDDKLRLDSNTDPRLSKDLPVISFKRM